MKKSTFTRNYLSLFAIVTLIVLLGTTVYAQTTPGLFRRPPQPATPGAHGSEAHAVEIDNDLLSTGPARLRLIIPGKPDLLFERDGVERRGAGNLVWRGRAQSQSGNTMVLTFHEGLTVGFIQSGNDSYTIRPGTGGRSILEKLNSESFRPEWGHDSHTHGHEKIPPSAGSDPTQGGSTTPTTSADSANQILLLSVYTPQARTAAGGTTQIQAMIQAAVDQANTAFINSNMIARYTLAHTAEVAHNDAGNIENDLNWVTSDPGVAALRNTYHADMVSLIVGNGGPYCGIAWVQRNPGSSFASYAFQVTDVDCLANHTFAHEHGHNMGFEHNPENGPSPAQASYPWSFGHWVNGSFRTVMSYNACTVSCPRILNFSNPDILHSGIATGILDQRDNAQTGDLIAPIVANFRLGESGGANNPPAFTSDPITKSDATEGQAYSGSIAGNATDPDADPLTFGKSAGPAWLSVAANGGLSGTPTASDLGMNSFTVNVSDGRGGSDTAALQINVVQPLGAPSNLAATAGSKQINLNWFDNSNGELGFKIERSNNGKSFSQIATVGAGVTSYSNTGLRTGRKYYYRVRAYNSAGNSAYSNTVSVAAN